MDHTIAHDLERARDEVSASSAGGAPFLIAYGLTLFVSAILYFFLPIQVVALVAMFQGSLALPLAFWLERRLGAGPMSPDNPLRPLSVQMAMSQILALPAVIVAYSLEPITVPVVLAAVGGAHFLTYAWLHRTRLYAVLAVAVSIGAFVLQLFLRSEAFPYILIYMSLVYWILAPLVYRHAASFSSRAIAR
jgi:hypothetical protein